MREPAVPPSPTMMRINVTPIIDVALVLVIILLITAPMLSVSDMNIKLPAADTREAEDQHRITLTLDPEGEIAIDDARVDPAKVAALLRARLIGEKDENTLVVVRADQSVPHRMVRDLIEKAHDAGAVRLAVATRQEGRARP